MGEAGRGVIISIRAVNIVIMQRIIAILMVIFVEATARIDICNSPNSSTHM